MLKWKGVSWAGWQVWPSVFKMYAMHIKLHKVTKKPFWEKVRGLVQAIPEKDKPLLEEISSEM